MSRVKFYWESKGEHYDFDPNKRYVIYFRGCFCCPTGAHFNTINAFTYLPNAKFIIHQGGSEKRHGVPYYLNRKIWKIYIKELMPRSKTVLLGRGKYKSSDIIRHPFVREADTIVFIAGNENYNPSETEYDDIHHKYQNSFREFSRKKEVIFLYLDRPEKNTISATELCKAVIHNRNKSNETKYNNLRKYFPSNLSNRGFKYIIDKLEQCDLH